MVLCGRFIFAAETAKGGGLTRVGARGHPIENMQEVRERDEWAMGLRSE